MAQETLADVEFADNPEPRCAVVLLLDTSGSMSGRPIQELNEGIQAFEKSLKADKLASLRVEISIVTFGPVCTRDVRGEGNGDLGTDAEHAFVTADNFQAPTLPITGDTPMGAAMTRALELIRRRKEIYKTQGAEYYRPWILLVTDGGPTDSYKTAAATARQAENSNSVVVYAVGVEGANMGTLAEFSNRQPLKLRGLAFAELFQWLSKSLQNVSTSGVGDQQVPLAPVGWATADTSH